LRKRRQPARIGPLAALRRAVLLSFTFSGRAGRIEFAWFMVFAVAAGLMLYWLALSLQSAGVTYPYPRPFFILVWLPWPALMVRRLHDTGHRGAYALLVLIPVVGTLLTLYLLGRKSQPGGRRFPPGRRQSRVAMVLSALLVLYVATYQPYVIRAGAMKPALLTGDYMLVNKLAYGWPCFGICGPSDRFLKVQPERGDVVVYLHPVTGQPTVGRVIGLPGETVQVSGGVVSIGGAALARDPRGTFDEPMMEQIGALPRCTNAPVAAGEVCKKTLLGEHLPGGKVIEVLDTGGGPLDDTPAFEVPGDHVFLLGDNRDNAADSRVDRGIGGPGMVPIRALIGRSSFILFSSRGNIWYNPATWRRGRMFLSIE